MKYLYMFLFISGVHLSYAQNTNISGVINDYTSISAINNNVVTVNTSSAFSPGDLAIIIQMKGAVIDETNTSSFGDVVDLNSTGNYELVNICSVPSATQVVVGAIQRTYDTGSEVQLIRVPEYNDATVTSQLLSSPWDGQTGGVIALKCNGNLTLNNDINVEAAGFSGAAFDISSYTCTWAIQVSDYFYDLSGGEGAKKGEGIANYLTGKDAGRGAQASGGGGGNDHNSGGGGGSNAGEGGVGGTRIAEGIFNCAGNSPGVGGKSHNYSNASNQIFLGGGGGAGHKNNVGPGSEGSNGGGLVIILADTVFANGHSILAGGASSTMAENGAGGGGAGGTVLLDVLEVSGSMNIDISGGDGGDIDNVGPSNCNGPGGGGGGGILWTSLSTVPLGITLDNSGGTNGITQTASQTNCAVGSANNATSGDSGASLTDLSIPYPSNISGIDSIVVCDSLQWIDGNTYYADTSGISYTINGGSEAGCDSTVTLYLTVSPIDTTVVQQEQYLFSNDTASTIQWYMSDGTIGSDGCGDNATLLTGETNDSLNTADYGGGIFFAVLSNDGCTDTTYCYDQGYQSIYELSQTFAVLVYPNPTTGEVNLQFGEHLEEIHVRLLSIQGKTIFKEELFNTSDKKMMFDLPKGVYFLQVESHTTIINKRLIIN